MRRSLTIGRWALSTVLHITALASIVSLATSQVTLMPGDLVKPITKVIHSTRIRSR